MKKIVILLFLAILGSLLVAQNGSTFSKLYTVIPGMPCQADRINVCSGGGGYVIYAGTLDSNNLSKVVMLKIDTLGNFLWKKSYGKSGYNYYDASLLPGGGGGVSVPWGGFIEIGTLSDAVRTWEKLLLCRFDGNGDTVWTKAYNDSANEWGVVAKVTRKKDYIIGGNWYKNNFGTLTLKKTDTLGNTIWQKTYHGAPSHSREGLSLDTCKDGGYIICAVDVDTSSTCGFSIFIMKVDSVGKPQWTQYITNQICGVGPSYILSLADGSYLVAGSYDDSLKFGYLQYSKMYLAKISSAGVIKWAKQYGHGSWDGAGLFSIKELSNGDIVACGNDSSNFFGCILKVDSNGNQKWFRYYEMQSPSEQDYLFDIQALPGGGYVAAGQTYGSTYNIWVVKTDSLGVTMGVNEVKVEREKVKVYPNPSNGVFTIALSHAVLPQAGSASQTNIEIYNVLGQQIYNATLIQPEAGQGDNRINLSNQSNGVYLYRVISENGNLIGEGKLVIER